MVSTPLSAPVIAATRLRGGNAASARGAASFAAQAVGTARAAGCTRTIVARMDSAYYAATVSGTHTARRVTSAAAGGDRQASQLRRALASADACRADAQTRRVCGTWRV